MSDVPTNLGELQNCKTCGGDHARYHHLSDKEGDFKLRAQCICCRLVSTALQKLQKLSDKLVPEEKALEQIDETCQDKAAKWIDVAAACKCDVQDEELDQVLLIVEQKLAQRIDRARALPPLTGEPSDDEADRDIWIEYDGYWINPAHTSPWVIGSAPPKGLSPAAQLPRVDTHRMVYPKISCKKCDSMQVSPSPASFYIGAHDGPADSCIFCIVADETGKLITLIKWRQGTFMDRKQMFDETCRKIFREWQTLFQQKCGRSVPQPVVKEQTAWADGLFDELLDITNGNLPSPTVPKEPDWNKLFGVSAAPPARDSATRETKAPRTPAQQKYDDLVDQAKALADPMAANLKVINDLKMARDGSDALVTAQATDKSYHDQLQSRHYEIQVAHDAMGSDIESEGDRMELDR